MSFFSWIGGWFKSKPKPVYDTWPTRAITYSFSPAFALDLQGIRDDEAREYVHEAARKWSSATVIELVYVESNPDILLQDRDLSGKIAGFGEFPAVGGRTKGMIFDNSQREWSHRLFQKVALHEFGHCLGLRHCATSSRIMYKKLTSVNRVTHYDARELNEMYKKVPG